MKLANLAKLAKSTPIDAVRVWARVVGSSLRPRLQDKKRVEQQQETMHSAIVRSGLVCCPNALESGIRKGSVWN